MAAVEEMVASANRVAPVVQEELPGGATTPMAMEATEATEATEAIPEPAAVVRVVSPSASTSPSMA